MDTKTQILEALGFRHACKEFNPDKKIPAEDFNVILEAARLSPSSFGYEPWNFLILQNMALREKIRPVCWGAQGQLPTASHFVVILARRGKDLRYNSPYLVRFMETVKGMAPDFVAGRQQRMHSFQEQDFELASERELFDWACKQAYIALANMLTAAALLRIDSCPIEGFNRGQLEEILAGERMLDREQFGIACMAAFGYRKAEPSRPKTRQTPEQIFRWIN
ncbi:MAG TPA: NAD(P)H-dependent oxidoreductase [Patescibacteria group bacterium]|nr:NAD(P)H-dependent oxidoreductase [Patescibacteria group bacterium]